MSTTDFFRTVMTEILVLLFLFILLIAFGIVSIPPVLSGSAVLGRAHIARPTPILRQPSEYDLIDVSHPPTDFYVCVPEAPVKVAPGPQYQTLRILMMGDNVQVQEWSKAGLWDEAGWAMIGRGIWIAGLDICRR